MLMRFLVTGIALMTVGASSCSGESGAPAGSASSSAQAQNVAVGSAVQISGDNNLKAFVTLESVVYKAAGTGAIAQPPKNGIYAVLDILVQDDSGTYDFNPLYFKYQDPDGTTYDAFSGNAITAGFDPSLSAGSLNAGQKTRGFVTFDVKAKGGVVQMTDQLGGVVGQWTAPAS